MRNFDKDHSLVRIINAIPQSRGLDINLNGKTLFRDISFTDFTPYVYMPPGEYLLEVYTSQDKTEPIFKKDIKIGKDKLLSLAIAGNEGDKISLIRMKDDKEAPEGNLSKVRFVHLVPNGKPVNILLDGNTYAYDVSYKDVTPYIDLEGKVYDIEIELSQNNQLIRKLRVNIRPNKIYTFYAMGNKPNFQVFQSSDGSVLRKKG